MIQAQQVHHSVSKELDSKLVIDYRYFLHIPKNDDLKDSGKLPLIVFLHGAGERGDDLDLVKAHGPPMIVDAQPKFPFAILSPQCKLGEMWNPTTLDRLLDIVIEENEIDENRIYLTGLSMGGRGTWDWAMYRPDRFAAIAPICGWGESFMASKLKDVPTWVFHGAMDSVVPIKEATDMIRAMKKSGNSKTKFTVYPDAGHDSWTVTYNNAQFYEWLLMNKKTP